QGVNWEKRWVARPEGMRVLPACFPYPGSHVRGTIRQIERAGQPVVRHIDLTARAGDSPVRLTGKIVGEGDATHADLELHIERLRLDDRVYQALSEESRRIARQFLPEEARRNGLDAHPMGHADADVFIRRRP